MDTLTCAHIWATLSDIDVAPFCTETEVVGDQVLTYLPWMKAHEIMMNTFPEYNWEFTEDPTGRECHYFDDGSAEVRCRMTIGGQTNITYLPVHRSGKAINSPSATDINTAKQRCRVKAMGEFGLGYTMWLSSQIKEIEEANVSETVQSTPLETDDADEANKIKEVWKLCKFDEAKTLSEAKKKYDKLKVQLANRGLEDDGVYWAKLCEQRGWRATK
ncbi:DUF1071 domain-containing protein [Akkermansiaceae bacterium]|nr:DUF1071 domain-containing protein [Akkermansiaceae bacterium]